MLRICKLNEIDYNEALALQSAIQQQRIKGECEDTLLLLEHPSVLTKGIRTKDENILLSKEDLAKEGMSIYESHRGGDVTYFGPGQIIGYIIMLTDREDHSVKTIVQKLEQVTINILAREFGITAHMEDKKYTGVFVQQSKITAIGISVKKRVTMHGFAMNVNTDLSYFDWIVPCGLPDRSVTSVEKLTGQKYSISKMKTLICEEIQRQFKVPTLEVTKEQLYQSLEDQSIEDKG